MKHVLFLLLLTIGNSAYASKCIDLIGKQDYYEAAEVCEKEASKGLSSAQFGMGILYYNGFGVIPDMKKAYKWMLKASENGLNQAQYNLGIMLANGQGTELDLVSAYAWLYIAKENGFADAAVSAEQLGSELSKKEKQQAEKKIKELLEKHYYSKVDKNKPEKK